MGLGKDTNPVPGSIKEFFELKTNTHISTCISDMYLELDNMHDIQFIQID